MRVRSHCAWALSRSRTSCPGVPRVIMTSRLQGNRDAASRRGRSCWDGWRRGRPRGWESSGRSSRTGRSEKWILINHQRTARTWWDLNQRISLNSIYTRAKAKAILFFDLLPLTHRCSINTQIGNNATGRSNINAPLKISWTAQFQIKFLTPVRISDQLL